jgi:hypothetical protein
MPIWISVLELIGKSAGYLLMVIPGWSVLAETILSLNIIQNSEAGQTLYIVHCL